MCDNQILDRRKSVPLMGVTTVIEKPTEVLNLISSSTILFHSQIPEKDPLN